MKKAILAKKVGMTQVFSEDGQAIPVTVLEAGPCTVVQKKTVDVDGYSAVQVAYGDIKAKNVNRPLKGHFKKAGVEPKRYLREFQLDDAGSYELGQQIKVDIFSPGEYVDVSAVSRGKGFAGSIKRHNQGRGPMSHGSHYHRGPGSLGSIDPARVFKGQTLPGHMGRAKVTVQNMQVMKVDADRNLLLIKGSVPGPRGGLVTVRNAIKKSNQ